MLRRFGQQQGRLRPVSQPVPPGIFLTIDDVIIEAMKIWQNANAMESALQRTVDSWKIGSKIRIRLPTSYGVVN